SCPVLLGVARETFLGGWLHPGLEEKLTQNLLLPPRNTVGPKEPHDVDTPGEFVRALTHGLERDLRLSCRGRTGDDHDRDVRTLDLVHQGLGDRSPSEEVLRHR